MFRRSRRKVHSVSRQREYPSAVAFDLGNSFVRKEKIVALRLLSFVVLMLKTSMILLHRLDQHVFPQQYHLHNLHCSSHHILLVSRNQAIRRGKLSIRPSERLSASAHRNQVLAILKSLALDQITKEIHQVTTEVADIRSVRSKAVNLIHTIAAIPQLPRVASDGDGSNRLPGGRNGTGTSQGGEPDHDFVFVFSACGAGGEDVVGHVGDDVGACLCPAPFCSQRLDLGDLDGVGFCDDVGVGFYLAGTAGP